MIVFRVETRTYTPTLVCDDEQDRPTMQLYSVLVLGSPVTPSKTVIVLARDEKMAADMARCHLKLSSYEVPPYIDELIKTYVTRVPFLVQGWGAQLF